MTGCGTGGGGFLINRLDSRLRGNDEVWSSGGMCLKGRLDPRLRGNDGVLIVILANAGIHCRVAEIAASDLDQQGPQLLYLVPHTGRGLELQIPGVVVHLLLQLADLFGDLRG